MQHRRYESADEAGHVTGSSTECESGHNLACDALSASVRSADIHYHISVPAPSSPRVTCPVVVHQDEDDDLPDPAIPQARAQATSRNKVPVSRPTITPDPDSKIPLKVRERYLNDMIELYLQKYVRKRLAYPRAAEVEMAAYVSCKENKKKYLNLLATKFREIRASLDADDDFVKSPVKTRGGGIKTRGGGVKTRGGGIKTRGGGIKTRGGRGGVRPGGGRVETRGGGNAVSCSVPGPSTSTQLPDDEDTDDEVHYK